MIAVSRAAIPVRMPGIVLQKLCLPSDSPKIAPHKGSGQRTKGPILCVSSFWRKETKKKMYHRKRKRRQERSLEGVYGKSRDELA